MRLLILALMPLALAACAEFPQLDALVTDRAKAAKYPSLIPEGEIGGTPTANRLQDGDGEALLERAELLRRRADGLRGTAADATVEQANKLRKRAEILRGIDEVNDSARQRYADQLDALGG